MVIHDRLSQNPYFVDFPSNILHCPILTIWCIRTFLSYAWPPPNPLLTQFRKLQPSPLEVGDHLISKQ